MCTNYCSMCCCTQLRFVNCFNRVNNNNNNNNEKALGGDANIAEPKIFSPPQTPFPGARDGQNLMIWRW